MHVDLAPIRSMAPAIVERLRLAFPADKFTIERCPAVMTVAEFERLTRRAPFIGLAWMGLTPAKNNARQIQGAWRWRLVLVVKAAGADERRFKGDAFDIGLDAVTDVAMALLQGAEIAPHGRATVTGAEAVYADGWADDATVVAQIDFEIETTLALSTFNLKTAEDFERLGIRWQATAAGDPAIVATKTDMVDPKGKA